MSKLNTRLEQANNYVLPFGRHKGKKLAQVIKDDWKYLDNILNGQLYNPKHTELKRHLMTIMYGQMFK